MTTIQTTRPQSAGWHDAKPATDAAARRDIRHDLDHLRIMTALTVRPVTQIDGA